LFFQRVKSFYSPPARIVPRGTGQRVHPIGDGRRPSEPRRLAADRAADSDRISPRRMALPRRAPSMFDFAMLALGCAFFVASIWYAIACERL
jgi:hypothetical protein